MLRTTKEILKHMGIVYLYSSILASIGVVIVIATEEYTLLSVTLAFLTVTFGMGSLLGLASIPSEKELIENYMKSCYPR